MKGHRGCPHKKRKRGAVSSSNPSINLITYLVTHPNHPKKVQKESKKRVFEESVVGVLSFHVVILLMLV